MKPIRVGIADHDASTEEKIREAIGKNDDFEVVAVACNGQECTKMVKEKEFDVLIIDLITPGFDGFSLIQEMKGHTKTIVLTAFASDDIVKRAMESGASYFMMKPFDGAQLLEQIRHVQAMQYRSVKASVEERIVHHLRENGIPPHIKGYLYIKEAVEMVHGERGLLEAVTKHLYPEIASRFHTTSSRVERAIRHAIDVAWKRGNVRDFHREKKPTNAEFIALLAEKVRMEN